MSNSISNHKGKTKSFITRKAFLKQSGISLLGISLIPSLGLGFSKKEHQVTRNDHNDNILRTIQYNVFNGCIGYKDINGRELPDDEKYDLVRAARNLGQVPRRIVLQLALYKPNIITFSEAPDEKTIAKMAGWLNMNYAYFPGAKDGKGHYPGSILTNYEIVSSENRPFVDKDDNSEKLFTRHWGKARLRLTNGEMITVHSTHLWPFTKNGGQEIRLEEIDELLKSIQDDVTHHTKSVLLQGDLNSTPDTPEHEKLTSAGLTDTFAKVGSGDGYTATSKDPHARIDYIYAIGEIAMKVTKSISLYEGDFRLNNADPKGFALSDHIPVLSGFNM